MEFKTVPFEIKQVDPEQGIIEGFAAVMGNRDGGGDRIFNGAFLKTIEERGDRIKVGWQHTLDHPMGRTVAIKEVGRDQLPPKLLERAPDATGGLLVQGKVSMTPTNKERLILMADSVVDELSIGYEVVVQEYPEEGNWFKRDLKELKLFEWSPVTIAMNPAAVTTSVKERRGEAMDPKEDKRAVPPHTTAKADEDATWDGPAERAAAEVEDLKVMAAIILGDGEAKGDYKLHHHQHGSGHPVVLKGVMAAGAAIQGARTPLQAPAADIAGAKRHLERHYDQFDRTAPWDKDFGPDDLKAYEPEDRPGLVAGMAGEALEGLEGKAGTELSGRQRQRVRNAISALESLLEADGDDGKGKAFALVEHEALQVKARAYLTAQGLVMEDDDGKTPVGAGTAT